MQNDKIERRHGIEDPVDALYQHRHVCSERPYMARVRLCPTTELCEIRVFYEALTFRKDVIHVDEH
jgi:hypothetical protein